jgi:hypothetical protein
MASTPTARVISARQQLDGTRANLAENQFKKTAASGIRGSVPIFL